MPEFFRYFSDYPHYLPVVNLNPAALDDIMLMKPCGKEEFQ
jgi:hypothetical protein